MPSLRRESRCKHNGVEGPQTKGIKMSTEAKETPTPETEEYFAIADPPHVKRLELNKQHKVVSAEVAQRLRRELEISKSCERMMCQVAFEVAAQCGLDTDNAEPPDVVEAVIEMKRQRDAALAENAKLREDKARLDWLSGSHRSISHLRYNQLSHRTATLREAIDFVMRKDGDE